MPLLLHKAIIIYVPVSKTNSETAVGSRRCALSSCATVTFQLFSKTEKNGIKRITWHREIRIGDILPFPDIRTEKVFYSSAASLNVRRNRNDYQMPKFN